MRKAFYITHKQYYFREDHTFMLPNVKYEIMIGDYPEEGGTRGEFSIRWTELGEELVPKLGVYDDAWLVLSKMPELIDLLASYDNQSISVDEMVEKLLELGYDDITSYTSLREVE